MKTTIPKKRKLTITMDCRTLQKLRAVSVSLHRSVSQQISAFVEKEIGMEPAGLPASLKKEGRDA